MLLRGRTIGIPLHVLLVSSAFGQAPVVLDTVPRERFSWHAQSTIVEQYKPKWNAPYSGTNSLITDEESRTSITGTLFAAARLWKGGSVVLNPEIAGGSGLSSALGVGDAPNGETFRVGDPAPSIYLARLYLRQVIPIGSSTDVANADANQLAGTVPQEYVAITAGKTSVADLFDRNSYAHDPRSQFLAWSLMGNGAWDYPANVRGYTPAVIAEYVGKRNELRAGIALLPTDANGNEMDTDIGRSRGIMVEYTRKWNWRGRKGALRVLAFQNTTHMGDYAASVRDTAGTGVADITRARAFGHTKQGFAINAEQQLNAWLGAFARVGWNDGRTETWVFTEIDHTLSLGLSADGARWKRDGDRAGLALVMSGLSTEHRNYLAAGGLGFMLGDGALRYAPERMLETYYAVQLEKDRLWLTGTYQLLIAPGYNADRQGPVNIFSVRVHWQV